MFENLLDPFKSEMQEQKQQGLKMLNLLNAILCELVEIKKELEAGRASKKGK